MPPVPTSVILFILNLYTKYTWNKKDAIEENLFDLADVRDVTYCRCDLDPAWVNSKIYSVYLLVTMIIPYKSNMTYCINKNLGGMHGQTPGQPENIIVPNIVRSPLLQHDCKRSDTLLGQHLLNVSISEIFLGHLACTVCLRSTHRSQWCTDQWNVRTVPETSFQTECCSVVWAAFSYIFANNTWKLFFHLPMWQFLCLWLPHNPRA